MQLSETTKLQLNEKQAVLIRHAMDEYVSAVNKTVMLAVNGKSISKFGSGDVDADIPSACRNQAVRDAKSIIKKHYGACRKAVLANRKLAKQGKPMKALAPRLPVLKRPVCYWNNQNFKVLGDGSVRVPVMIDGRSTRITLKTTMTERQMALFSEARLGTLRIVLKGRTLMANVTYEASEVEPLSGGHVMGVDLGIKCPAVTYCSDGKVGFHGNGRKNRYMRRFYANQRKKLQKSKMVDVVKQLDNKEQRIMRDIDHKISRGIMKEAEAHKVKVIKMERVNNIRSTTRKSRKNNHSLHNWSFYRLAQYISYKAKLAGIEVLFVNPAYTSQRCPACGVIHRATDRLYKCQCGYKQHRDIVGAINICASTEICGNSISA